MVAESGGELLSELKYPVCGVGGPEGDAEVGMTLERWVVVVLRWVNV